MKIAVMSDIHDHVSNMLTALQLAEARGCHHLIYTGDIVELSTLKLLISEWKYPADIVFGNNEYDRELHQKLAQEFPNIRHHGFEGDIVINSRAIYFTHFPHIAQDVAMRGRHNIVFFGHTHRAEQFRINNTILVNPGEVCGNRYAPSFAVYDSENHTVNFVRL